MEWWNNAKWCHLAVNWTPATVLVWLDRAVCYKSLTQYLVYAPISPTTKYHFPNLVFFVPPPPHLKRHGEWIGFNSCCLDGLPMQFFKTHFTDTIGAIKDPQRNISIEECLYFASIVHLLWQTSKGGVSALLNAIYCGMRYFDGTGWTLSPCLFSAERKTADKL